MQKANMNGLHAIVEVNGRLSRLGCQALLALMENSAAAAGATVLAKHSHQFGGGKGCTAVVLLAESHISVHTWPEHDYAAFDIFMCGETTLSLALEVLYSACDGGDTAKNPRHFFTKIIRRGRHHLEDICPEKLAVIISQEAPLVVTKISDAFKFSESKSLSALAELVKFLLLCSESNQVLVPSIVVDGVWRQLLVFTRVYENFCQHYLSRFIHYQPTNISEGCHLQYQKTLALYENRFGPRPEAFWPSAEFSSAQCDVEK